jgi:hypothetical protein
MIVMDLEPGFGGRHGESVGESQPAHGAGCESPTIGGGCGGCWIHGNPSFRILVDPESGGRRKIRDRHGTILQAECSEKRAGGGQVSCRGFIITTAEFENSIVGGIDPEHIPRRQVVRGGEDLVMGLG